MVTGVIIVTGAIVFNYLIHNYFETIIIKLFKELTKILDKLIVTSVTLLNNTRINYFKNCVLFFKNYFRLQYIVYHAVSHCNGCDVQK